MPNISKEDDKRDFEERRKNNWNRPNVGPTPKTQKELLDESNERVEQNKRELEAFRRRYFEEK